MKPATQAIACSASTSALRPMTCSTWPMWGWSLSGRNDALGSGGDTVAMSQTAHSSATEIASAPAPSARRPARGGRSTRRAWLACRRGRGRGRGPRSAPHRIGARAGRPRAAARTAARALRSGARAARGGDAGMDASEAQLGHEQRGLAGDPPRHLRAPEPAVAKDDRQLDDAKARRIARWVSSTWKA